MEGKDKMEKDIMQILKEAGFKPEATEDDGGFGMIEGKYIVRIESAGRVNGIIPRTGQSYDFFTVKMQVAEILEGDKATNRYLDKIYNPDIDGIKRLLTDLHTSGIEVEATTEEELNDELAKVRDRTMNVRCWVWKNRKDKEGNPLKDVQMVKVVKEFKGIKEKPAKIETEVPF